jgi:serine kinase of HPr protein (carbohydrate metabolism regulator)
VTTANIHATCLLCAGAGIPFGAANDAGLLLTGESGSGKSDLALRLISMGAQLVADDRCEIFCDDTGLRVRPPRNTSGLMEIRGLGILALPFIPETRIALVVRVTGAPSSRLPRHRRYQPPKVISLPENLRPPEIVIDAFAASSPAKILAAVAAFEKQLFREEIGT